MGTSLTDPSRVRVVLLNLVLSTLAILIAYSAFLLDGLLPFRLPPDLTVAVLPLLGFGTAVIVWAAMVLARHGGASGVPGDPTKKLVTTGPYALIRNPIYAGGALVIVGLAIVTRSPFMLLYGVLFCLGVDLCVRKVEEPAALRRLGQRYAEYQAVVPRWFPRLRGGMDG